MISKGSVDWNGCTTLPYSPRSRAVFRLHQDVALSQLPKWVPNNFELGGFHYDVHKFTTFLTPSPLSTFGTGLVHYEIHATPLITSAFP